MGVKKVFEMFFDFSGKKCLERDFVLELVIRGFFRVKLRLKLNGVLELLIWMD